jgi:hypothetical protein
MVQSNKTSHKRDAWHALRRTLPPWRFEENLNELIDYVQHCSVDEVIIKVDTEEFSHGHPSIEWAKKYQTNLFQIKEEMDKVGVVYSLNPWVTVGHIDRGRDTVQDFPGWQTMVGHDGVQCSSCACPLCPQWRSYIRELWTLYAQTKPHVMWVEDDIRTFNHLPVKFGCFCPIHIKLFSQHVGKNIDREALVAAIFKTGTPHAHRTQFLDMQSEVMTGTAAFLAEVVHNTSPETHMGLMSSGPRNHCMEGRNWRKFTQALANGRRLYSRAPLGNYNEESLRGCYFSHDAIKSTRYCMPSDYIELTEVENYPYTLYSTSATFTFLQMALTYAYGSNGTTLNLYDHCGTPMKHNCAFGNLLSEKKPFLNALANRAQETGIFRGVRLLHHDQSSYHKQLNSDATFEMLGEDGYSVMEMFESHGLATTYDDSDVIATCGQTLRAFSDEQIYKMLQGGMYIDAVAANVLAERGFAKNIGLKSIAPPQCIDLLGAVSAEEYFNEAFGGSAHTYMTVTLPDLGQRPDFSTVELSSDTQIISRLVDPDTNPGHTCMYAFENSIGGRVIVHLFDLATAFGTSFKNPFRAKQLRSAIEWLSREKVPLSTHGGVYPLSFRKECKTFTLLGLFNLTLDAWPVARFDFYDERIIDTMEILSEAGQWQQSQNLSFKCVDGKISVQYDGLVECHHPLFITVRFK